MPTKRLRNLGGSLVMINLPSYAKQNGLNAGSCVSVLITGDELVINPRRGRKTLAELLSATQVVPSRVGGWDEIQPVGAEQ